MNKKFLAGIALVSCALAALFVAGAARSGAESTSAIMARLALCQKVSDTEAFRECSEEPITELAVKVGLLEAQAVFEKSSTENNWVNCHDVMHALGRSYAQSSPRELAKASSPVCEGGMLDGALEERLKTASLAEITEYGQKYCLASLSPDMNYPSLCGHALGHAFWLITDKNRDSALRSCSELSDGAVLQTCAEGVFMLRYVELLERTGPSYDSVLKGLAECDSVPLETLPACPMYAMSLASLTTTEQITGVINACLDLPHVAGLEFGCMTGFSQILPQAPRPLWPDTLRLCPAYRGELANECARASLFAAVDMARERSIVDELCRAAGRDPENDKVCASATQWAKDTVGSS